MANYLLDILSVLMNTLYVMLGVPMKSKKELAKEELARMKLASDETEKIVKDVKKVIQKSMRAKIEREARFKETMRRWRAAKKGI